MTDAGVRAVPCWQCREPVEGPVCVGCGTVQPPPASVDYCRVLKLPRRYHLDAAEIERAWREQSRLVHPDRHVARSAVQRRMSLQWTALLNEARRVLKDPLRRANWLATGSPEPGESGVLSLPEDFLDRVFGWRMAIESGETDVRREVLEAWRDVHGELDALFRAWEGASGDLAAVPEKLARIRALGNIVALVGSEEA